MNEQERALTFAQALARELAREDGWAAPGGELTAAIELPFASTRALAESWEHGKVAAKIRWGTDGAMKRCIRLARKYMTDPGGYCATRHKAATGEWPAEEAIDS